MSKWLVLGTVVIAVLYLARGVLSPLIISAALAYIFSPLIDEAQERSRLPRFVVVALSYVVLLSLLGLGIWALETRVVREVAAFSQEGPSLVDVAFVRLLGTDRFVLLGQEIDPHLMAVWVNQQIADLLGTPSDALHVAERAVDVVLKTFLTLVALFYLLMDGRRFVDYFLRLVPPDRRGQTQELIGKIHVVLARYLRGQLFLIVLMAGVTYPVLAFGFGLPFAVPIALATGVLEIIPLFGPIAAATVAALVALSHGGPGMMIAIIVVYIVLRQIEDQLVMPIVVGRAVELHPLVTIFAVLTGGATAGALGAVLAIPIAAAMRVTLDQLFPDAENAGTPPNEARSAESEGAPPPP